MKEQAYYLQHRSEMLPFVPDSASRILEVGCGAGSFLQALQRGDRELWGMDINADQAVKARPFCARLLIGDAMELAAGLPDGYFDCVVFNDVLEHVAWPGELLARMRGKLKPDGRLVASIPNVRYIDVLARELLWEKDFRYTPEGGLLDDTHLRFFTRRSMFRLLRGAGYEVVRCQGIRPCKSWKEKLLIALSCGFLSDCRYKCFALSARPVATGEAESAYL